MTRELNTWKACEDKKVSEPCSNIADISKMPLVFAVEFWFSNLSSEFLVVIDVFFSLLWVCVKY